jgi:mono/diheme cytochrome c family protein
MKLRYAFIFAIIALALSACTLAADVTPPPGYVAPTPQPTLGPLFPAQAPDIQNGAAIYVEKCAPCHGNMGLGDGEKGKQLPVTVPAFALPETAHKASPAQWFTTVTQGNLDRFMPPFASLNDQQRWDVVSFALTLHTTAKQVEDGKALFESKCVDCADKFKDQKRMAKLSESDIINIIKNGEGDIPAFGKDFTDEQATAVAVYIRTLTFAPPPPTPTIAPATETPVAAEAGTPPAVETPLEGTAQAQVTTEATAGVGIVHGTVDNKTGKALPTDTIVTLHGFDHGSDPTSGPQEVATLKGTLNADGSFKFENVEMPAGRIFLADVEYQGVQYQSDFAPVEAGKSELALPPVTIYEVSTDLSLLKFQQVHLFSDFANEGFTQILEVYTFTNTSDKAVKFVTDGQSIPFITLPKGATEVGFQLGQDSAPFMGSTDGVAIPPNEKAYSVVAFFNLPYDKKTLEINQSFVLDAPSVLLLIPEGLKVNGDQLTSGGIQKIQNASFQTFTASDLKAGDTLTFTISGEPTIPATAESTAPASKNQPLLIGIGIFGVALISAGVWLYLRDRNRPGEEKEEDKQDEFASSEDVMDAILALDDLHRAGKISDEAYENRRAELKDILKSK